MVGKYGREGGGDNVAKFATFFGDHRREGGEAGRFGGGNLVVCGIFAIFANIFDSYDRI